MSDTLTDWALDFVLEERLDAKCRPARPPGGDALASRHGRSAPSVPGRPAELDVVEKAPRTPKRAALKDTAERAKLLHTFWHHELQAAELFCWALLAFPDAPDGFRQGLTALWSDEVRHMQLYQRRVEELGHSIGEFPVRDWFWKRVPQSTSPAQFLALMGLGLEAANLDHCDRFATWFEEVGDERSAAVQRRVGKDEVRHVRFATRWFTEFTGKPLDYESWSDALPGPLTPVLFVGPTVNREARLEAGQSAELVDAAVRSRTQHVAERQAVQRADNDRRAGRS